MILFGVGIGVFFFVVGFVGVCYGAGFMFIGILVPMFYVLILTFVAMIAGIVGGMLVSATTLDISPVLFLSRIQDNVGLIHFWVGMAKAPIFAFLIAVIGCLAGFRVQGSAQSVGEHTTSAVVQSIFVVIVVDAVAALFCMEMGW